MRRSRIALVAAQIAWLSLVGCAQSSETELAYTATCSVDGPTRTLPDAVRESSGAVFSRSADNLVWTHNDSGGTPEVHALDVQGTLVGSVRISGAENDDWEDIAIGPCSTGTCLFLADIGDNSADRREVSVYAVPEPAPDDQTSAPATRYRVRYPDGPRDAEALFLLAGRVHIVTKGGDSPITLYRYPGELNPSETVTLEAVRTLSAGPVGLADRVTGADVTPDGRWVLIRSYTSMLAYRASQVDDPAATAIELDLAALAPGQGEGIAAGPNGRVVLTSESIAGIPGTLVTLRCPFLVDTALAESSSGARRMARESR